VPHNTIVKALHAKTESAEGENQKTLRRCGDISPPHRNGNLRALSLNHIKLDAHGWQGSEDVREEYYSICAISPIEGPTGGGRESTVRAAARKQSVYPHCMRGIK
jgi:hypothetical protein